MIKGHHCGEIRETLNDLDTIDGFAAEHAVLEDEARGKVIVLWYKELHRI